MVYCVYGHEVGRSTTMWRKTGFTSVLGPEHQFPDKFTAIATIFNKLDPEICRRCTARIFWECKTAPGPGTADTPAA